MSIEGVIRLIDALRALPKAEQVWEGQDRLTSQAGQDK